MLPPKPRRPALIVASPRASKAAKGITTPNRLVFPETARHNSPANISIQLNFQSLIFMRTPEKRISAEGGMLAIHLAFIPLKTDPGYAQRQKGKAGQELPVVES